MRSDHGIGCIRASFLKLRRFPGHRIRLPDAKNQIGDNIGTGIERANLASSTAALGRGLGSFMATRNQGQIGADCGPRSQLDRALQIWRGPNLGEMSKRSRRWLCVRLGDHSNIGDSGGGPLQNACRHRRRARRGSRDQRVVNCAAATIASSGTILSPTIFWASP